MKTMIRKSTSYLLTLIMILGLLGGIKMPVNASSSSGDTILAFTSDAHNEPTNEAGERLGNWIDKVNSYVSGKIDFMGFCGDMGRSSTEPVDSSVPSKGYWELAQDLIDVVDGKGIDAAYTTGNHECNSNDGKYDPSKSYEAGSTESKFSVNKLVKSTAVYEMYCLGSEVQSQQYTENQITLLKNYFSGISKGSKKIYFIITHYPFHRYNSRTTSNADKVVSAINDAVNAKEIDVVVIWGHTHTESDSNYGKVYAPGEASSIIGSHEFYYMSAGCMSDSENTTGHGGNIQAKGLMARIASSGNSFSFGFFDKEGNLIGSEQSFKPYAMVPKYTVTFNLGGHGTNVPSQTVREGKTATKPASDPSATGYRFDGWFADSGFSKAFDFSQKITANTTVYAKWTQAFTVEFQVSGIGTTPKTQTVYKGGKATKPADPTSTEYAFKGWFSDGSFAKEYDFNAEVTGNITLYAKWVHVYTLSFNANGHGTAPEAIKAEYDATVSAPAAPTASGWKFNGWYREKSCLTAWDFSKDTVTDNITLFAKWSLAESVVTNAKVTLKSVKPGKKKATVTWAPNSALFQGYQVYFKIKGKAWKNGGTVKGATVKSKVIKKLKKGKKTSFKVRGYRVMNGKTVYSAFSKTITKKIK